MLELFLASTLWGHLRAYAFCLLLVCAVIESRSMPAPINANTASGSTRDASARMGKALQYRAAQGSSAAASGDDGPATVSSEAAERPADGGEFSDLLARMQAASAAGMTLETSNGGLTNSSNDAHERSLTMAEQQVWPLSCTCHTEVCTAKPC